jgi:hypothetical protein
MGAWSSLYKTPFDIDIPASKEPMETLESPNLKSLSQAE